MPLESIGAVEVASRGNAALEVHRGQVYRVLDQGFIRLVDYMGNEDAIVSAARVSYGNGTKSKSDDRGLIRYLMRHRHTSPLEQCEIVFHMKLPIFVARQLVRHRMASLNEVSARYSVLPEEFYVPAMDQIKAQATDNKQGRGDLLGQRVGEWFTSLTIGSASEAFNDYNVALDSGIARELARINLPLNTYTEWYWKIDLHNLLHFLSLRLDSHAQYEIRVYAEAIAEMVKEWVPNVWDAFEDYRLDAVTYSKQEAAIIRDLIRAHVPEHALRDALQKNKDTISQRERTAFFKSLWGET